MFAYTYGTRTVDLTENHRERVFTRVVHRETCRYAEGAAFLSPWQERDLVKVGFDQIEVNPGHRPMSSVWRSCDQVRPPFSP